MEDLSKRKKDCLTFFCGSPLKLQGHSGERPVGVDIHIQPVTLTGEEAPVAGGSDHGAVVSAVGEPGDKDPEFALIGQEGIPQTFVGGNAAGDDDVFGLIFPGCPHGFFEEDT